MFAIGEKIIYGAMGVCTVEDITVPDMPGARESYVLRPHYVANAKVYAPVEGNPVVMRTLMDEQQVHALIDSMPEMSALSADKERQELYQLYRGIVKSADNFLLAKLLKTLHQKKALVAQQRKIVPSAEKEIFDTAERVLFGEIAACLGIELEEVDGYIAARLQTQPEEEQLAVS